MTRPREGTGEGGRPARSPRWVHRPDTWAYACLGMAVIVLLLGWAYTHHVLALVGSGFLVLSIPVWVIAGWRAGLGWALAGAAAFAHTVPQFVPRFSDVAAGCTLRILTYNTLSRTENDAETALLVREVSPDFIFLQETGDPQATAAAITALPGWENASVMMRPQRSSLAISRFPMWVRDGEWADQRVETSIEGVPVSIWNVHGPKDFMSQENYDIYHAKLFAEIAQTRHARIVAGDFNATDLTPEMRKLLSVLDDAFQTAGWGFGFTFPGPARAMGRIAPFLRIDRVLYSREFDVASIERLPDSRSSDHYPVVADMIMVGKGEVGAPCKPQQ